MVQCSFRSITSVNETAYIIIRVTTAIGESKESTGRKGSDANNLLSETRELLRHHKA